MREGKKLLFIKFIFLIFTVVNIIFLGNLSFPQVADLKKREVERIRQWEKDLKLFPVPLNAVKLQYKFSFPGEELERDGIYFVGADHMCLDNNRNIYVSDSRNNCIFKFDSQGKFQKKIGEMGQGPGEFDNILFLDTDKENNLIIYDDGNRRIQILDFDGHYIKSFKIFSTAYKMISNKQEYIYAGLRVLNQNDPLIGIFDYQGKLLNSFGKPLNLPAYSYGPHLIHMSLNNKNGEIFIAWSSFPIVRRYSREGKLLSEYEIKHKIMNEYGKRNHDGLKKSPPASILYTVIRSIRAKEDGFYIFRYYPQIEILEINLKGDMVNTYWSDQAYNFIASDFMIIEGVNEKYIYCLQRYPENKINVYHVKK